MHTHFSRGPQAKFKKYPTQTTCFGPLLAPILSGFVSPTIGWRWSFWIALFYAIVTFVPLMFLPETFAPVLLARRAKKIRKENPGVTVIATGQLEKLNFQQLVTRVLTRPIRMLLFEPIVSCTCIYLALCYSIFYMSFQVFPYIFQGVYHLSPGLTGVAFLPIGVGSLLSLPIFWAYDEFILRAQARDAAWAKLEEYRRVPLACLGGPLFVVALFWLGFTAREEIHFILPMLAGVPFGIGFMLIFMALLNYLADAYEIYSASANAAASTCRSLLATVLPLATAPMFARLGIAGACSLLGGLSAGMCVIPFVFIKYGARIRAGSAFCIYLKERREEMERQLEAQRAREALNTAQLKSGPESNKETV
jgi:MFS family permease